MFCLLSHCIFWSISRFNTARGTRNELCGCMVHQFHCFKSLMFLFCCVVNLFKLVFPSLLLSSPFLFPSLLYPYERCLRWSIFLKIYCGRVFSKVCMEIVFIQHIVENDVTFHGQKNPENMFIFSNEWN